MMAKIVPWAKIVPGHTYWMDKLDAPSVISCECFCVDDSNVYRVFKFTDTRMPPSVVAYPECEAIRYWDSEPTERERMTERRTHSYD